MNLVRISLRQNGNDIVRNVLIGNLIKTMNNLIELRLGINNPENVVTVTHCCTSCTRYCLNPKSLKASDLGIVKAVEVSLVPQSVVLGSLIVGQVKLDELVIFLTAAGNCGRRLLKGCRLPRIDHASFSRSLILKAGNNLRTPVCPSKVLEWTNVLNGNDDLVRLTHQLVSLTVRLGRCLIPGDTNLGLELCLSLRKKLGLSPALSLISHCGKHSENASPSIL